MAYTEYTETSSRGWLDRIGGSFRGIIAGFVVIGLGTWLLWWNEGRTFRRAGVIGEAQVLAQDVQDISRVDPALEGRLIHATGRADTTDVLRDPVFGVSATAISIGRRAEYYQWTEESRTTKRKEGTREITETTYEYRKKWTGSPVDSSTFKNPEYNGSATAGAGGADVGPNDTLARFDNASIYAPKVAFGAYQLSEAQKRGIGGAIPLNVSLASEDAASIVREVRISELYRKRYIWGAVSADELIHASGNTVYIGLDPGAPRIGDVRVTFTQTPPADISIIARVVRDTFEPYSSPNGNGTFSRLNMGTLSMEKMFEDAKSENSFMAWLLRVVGALVVVMGFRMILSPLAVLVDVIPILGAVVDAGVGIVSFLLGAAWSLLVIAAAWLRFRPVVAGCLIAAAVILALLPSFLRRRRAASR